MVVDWVECFGRGSGGEEWRCGWRNLWGGMRFLGLGDGWMVDCLLSSTSNQIDLLRCLECFGYLKVGVGKIGGLRFFGLG